MWFGASLLYRSSEPLTEYGTHLFEERIVILAAHDETEARKKANDRGALGEEQYINMEGALVAWTFERTLEVKAILEDELGDGVEVFQRFLREDEVRSLLGSIAKP